MRTTRWNASEIGQARVLRGYLQRRIVLEVPSADPNKRSCQGNRLSTLSPDWSSWSLYPLLNRPTLTSPASSQPYSDGGVPEAGRR